MQPRTKIEKEVMALSAKLPKLTLAQRNWAERQEESDRTAYVNKRFAWCSECGELLPKTNVIMSDIHNNKIICPHCGKELKIKEKSLGVIFYKLYYVNFVTTCKGYQVFRTFLVKKLEQRNCKADYSMNEAVQIWLNGEGKETIVARSSACMGGNWRDDNWLFTSEMSIKHRNRSSFYYGDERYHIFAHHTYSSKKFIPELIKKGYKGGFLGLNPMVIAKNILASNDYEYLVKTNQLAIFKYLSQQGKDKIPFKHAVNICNRNNYIVKDASLWYDMIEALDYVGKDTHSPLLVCPNDLKEAHDKAMELKKRKLEKVKEEQKRKDAMEWEIKYKESKEKFFDLVISNDNLTIKVLRSVEEFMNEGKFMHHCVFSNEYYKKDNCLILSARNNEGERVETIEVNLDTFTIIQSRGVCNSHTIYHQEIINLMYDNMEQIRAITTLQPVRATA